MAVLNCIKKRYSVRAYLDKPVEAEKINAVLEAARLAPSARNCQQLRYVVVQDKNTIQRLCEAANKQAFVGQAPVVIIACAVNLDYVMRCGQTAYPIDTGIALEHVALQAVEEGLGTCWVGSFFEDQIKAILGIPEQGVRVVELMTLGYPADKMPEKKRVDIAGIVSRDKWSFPM